MFTDVLAILSLCSEFDIDLCHCGVIKSHVFSHFYAVVDSHRRYSVLTCYAFYSFSFVYILYSTAVIWRINFIISLFVFARWHTGSENELCS